MCLIVDANQAALIFGNPGGAGAPAAFAPIVRWLGAGGCIVHGGLLSEELSRVASVRRYLVQLDRAGRARRIAADLVEREEEEIQRLGGTGSNDAHVIALARASGARTLCSADQLLHADFKNPRLLAKPRGAVYQLARHRRLLRHTSSCGR